jgi:hypothetical protein
MKQLEDIRTRTRPEDIPTGPALEAARERLEAWLRDSKRKALRPTGFS